MSIILKFVNIGIKNLRLSIQYWCLKRSPNLSVRRFVIPVNSMSAHNSLKHLFTLYKKKVWKLTTLNLRQFLPCKF